jgi:hypothetical protein
VRAVSRDGDRGFNVVEQWPLTAFFARLSFAERQSLDNLL